MTNMQQLSLAFNKLHGTLPPEWSGLKNLVRLDLNTNDLTGAIPGAWASWKDLQLLDLSTNDLSGTLEEWEGCSSLLFLHLQAQRAPPMARRRSSVH